MTHGLVPKIFSNAILTYGFNWLVENGKSKPTPKLSTLQIGSNVFENSLVRISKVTFIPEAIPIMHHNEYPRIIIPLQTGILEKVNAHGEYIEQRAFTRGFPFKSPKTSPENPHGNINRGKDPLTFLIIEIKN